MPTQRLRPSCLHIAQVDPVLFSRELLALRGPCTLLQCTPSLTWPGLAGVLTEGPAGRCTELSGSRVLGEQTALGWGHSMGAAAARWGHCMRLMVGCQSLRDATPTQELQPACRTRSMSPLAEGWTEAISGLAFIMLLTPNMATDVSNVCQALVASVCAVCTAQCPAGSRLSCCSV